MSTEAISVPLSEKLTSGKIEKLKEQIRYYRQNPDWCENGYLILTPLKRLEEKIDRMSLEDSTFSLRRYYRIELEFIKLLQNAVLYDIGSY